MSTKEKDMNLAFLFDFYGELLSDQRKEVFELYYNDDLSLSEIAEQIGITRQGVRDTVKKAEKQLSEYESKLGLAGRFKKITESCERIALRLEAIEDEGNRRVLDELVREVKRLSEI